MSTQTVTVRMIAFLDTYRKERGLPTTVEVQVDQPGVSARDIADELGLPVDAIEGVFLNHRGHGLDVTVRGGDRIAFVPRGTPASHPAFFGAFDARDA